MKEGSSLYALLQSFGAEIWSCWELLELGALWHVACGRVLFCDLWMVGLIMSLVIGKIMRIVISCMPHSL